MKFVKGKRTRRPRPSSRDKPADEISVSTEDEEQEVADCLILLSQGFRLKKEREEKGNIKDEYSKSKESSTKSDSLSTGNADSYKYKCKSCNRTFPSFQALGGHRTSHKKPRKDQTKDEEVKVEEVKGHTSNLATSSSIHGAEIKGCKVHECSVCGSEFSSGQALGGHMRRHRAVHPVKAASVSEEETNDHKMINISSFDLNLPASPEDDETVESNVAYRCDNHLVFSGPVLVGCYY